MEEGRKCLIAIAGPSGSGKTTIVRSFERDFPTYIESTTGNPYLSDLLAGRSQFNAYANQRWFLDRIGEAVESADRQRCIIMDQDPAAVVDVYSGMFHDEGRINMSEMETLRLQLGEIDEQISQWADGSFVLFLDATPEILFQRAVSRAAGTSVPELSWFQKVRSRFLEEYQETSNVERLDTTNLSISEVWNAALDFVNRKLGISGEAKR